MYEWGGDTFGDATWETGADLGMGLPGGGIIDLEREFAVVCGLSDVAVGAI